MRSLEGKRAMMPDAMDAPVALGDVLIMGLGVSGRACVDYLAGPAAGRWSTLTLYGGVADEQAMPWAQRVIDAGGRVVFDDEHVVGAYDLGIVSPGIPETSAFYQSARAACAELIGELEFAWRESRRDVRWVAITGTNGKTTTTTLTAEVLRAIGLNAQTVGNIGDAAITAIADRTVDIFVAETSSFQLASTIDFAPDAAVLLNITPDHLAWHGDYRAYADAKARIFARLAEREGALAVLNATDDETRALVRAMRADDARGFAYLPIGTARGVGGDMRRACGSDNAAFIDEAGDFVIALDGRETTIDLSAGFGLVGAHNRINGLAAAAVGVHFGGDPARIGSALTEARALPHRIEPAGVVRGVAYYNDSKATNVDATLVALRAFEPDRPIVLLGGRDKGTDLSPLVAACEEHAAAVICFGEARERFLAAFGQRRDASSPSVHEAKTMASAVDCAARIARPGDIVLLSPACASFDEFSCFEERGDAFKALVAAREERS